MAVTNIYILLNSLQNAIVFMFLFSSVQSFSRFRLFATHESQHARPPCPSPNPAQTYVHQAGDAIQPSHPLLSHSPPAFIISQRQGLFQ